MFLLILFSVLFEVELTSRSVLTILLRIVSEAGSSGVGAFLISILNDGCGVNEFCVIAASRSACAIAYEADYVHLSADVHSFSLATR